MKVFNRRGASTIEVICYTGYAILAAIVIIMGYLFIQRCFRVGNDNRMVLTALRDAQSDVIGKSCIVRGCNGGSECTHWSDGVNTAYFNNVTNSLSGVIPKGYNEYKKMTIEKKNYYGEAGTMVIKVTYDGDNISADWVKGK